MAPSKRFVAVTAALAILSAFAGGAAAQEADAGTAAPTAPGHPAPADDTALPSPPALTTHVEAAYPELALGERREGSVGLELHLDESGHVVDVRVTSPAGHGFDEAAVAAARQFTFAPARKAGQPIPATVEFTYEFHVPPAPPPTPPAGPAAPSTGAKEVTQAEANQSTLVLGSRPISAASSFSVRDRDFALRPVGSVQDVLRVTPGLVVVQHSGGGKANQYFLRGFDADHGTDLALSIDGVPINLPSHAHGQGFADTNFIIPEAVERVEITKGPYFSNQGDFATAGAVNMVTRDDFEHSSIGLGFGGSPRHGEPSYRALLIASPHFETTKATFAVDVGRQNGPFDNPEGWDRYKLWNKVTFTPTKSSRLTVGEMSYGGNWHGSGQIPARAVDRGLVSRYGSLDPDEGGNTARHQVYVQYRVRPTENGELSLLAYLGSYRFNLFSNFTLFLRDPNNGDEIEQIDRRAFYGSRVSYRVADEFGGVHFDTTLGGDGRSDDIHEELWNTVQRRELTQARGSHVQQTSVGAFVNEEITPSRWFRVNVGGRADLLSFAVDDDLHGTDAAAPRSGADAASQLSPKASAIVTPLARERAQVDVYVNYGHGFHSNDVRGAFSAPRVTPLTRAIGEEVGSRARLWDRWDLAAALWQLDLDSETVWSGDEGTTAVTGATTRRGVEFETRYEFFPWLAADVDLTFTKSRFTTDGDNGHGLALAPKQTWSGGLSVRHELGPGTIRSGFRFYGIGDRPASDDGVLVAPGFSQFDLHLGYRHRRFDAAVDVENLFDGVYRSAQFATVSRLPTEPALGAPVPSGFTCGRSGRIAPGPTTGTFGGCEDVDYTPAYPLTLRVLATLFLD